jgi:D-tagatose-1,6-bisphosphate aldolase subunit GatZ/KbaZ
MSCADDPPGVAEEILADRAAMLCQTAERACKESGQNADSLMYVVGTEVPTPGGEQAGDAGLRVTETARAQETLRIMQKSFAGRGLDDAWERVIALVVQPGVEFGDESVRNYDRESARSLSEHLPASPALIYEAHSTDYQTPSALQHMVQDHFAILKVGPWLTFAMREAIFALCEIERDWLGGRADIQLSNVRGALDSAMLSNTEHWKAYYSGNPSESKFARRFSFSDRCRYYWFHPYVEGELKQLFRNLESARIPLTALSQFMPLQYEKVRGGRLKATPSSLINDSIRNVLRIYAESTGSTS